MYRFFDVFAAIDAAVVFPVPGQPVIITILPCPMCIQLSLKFFSLRLLFLIWFWLFMAKVTHFPVRIIIELSYKISQIQTHFFSIDVPVGITAAVKADQLKSLLQVKTDRRNIT